MIAFEDPATGALLCTSNGSEHDELNIAGEYRG
jgi:hypothetical protein